MSYKIFSLIAMVLLSFSYSVLAGDLRYYHEAGGLLVMDVEFAAPNDFWSEETSILGFRGSSYYVASTSRSSPGNGILEYPFKMTQSGDYQLQWRSYIALGSDPTQSDDSYVRIIDSDHNTVIPSNESELVPTGDWYKIYMNRLFDWSWEARNVDDNPKAIYWPLVAGESYTFQISVRSQGHAIDRILLWNRANSVSYGTDTGSGTGIIDSLLPSIIFTEASDLDQGSEAWQLANGFSPSIPNDESTLDSDSDGDLDMLEIFQGTDRNDPAEFYGFQNTVWDGANFKTIFRRGINQDAVSGIPEWSTDLKNWYRSWESNGTVAVQLDETLFNEEDQGSQEDPYYLEENGLLLMDAEFAALNDFWSQETSILGFTASSYYVASTSRSSPGNGILEYPFKMTQSGDYQLQWRSYITLGFDPTQSNDSYVRIIDSDGNTVIPSNESELVPTGDWYKIYMNRFFDWSWEARNVDDNPKAIYWPLVAGESYTFQISVRSQGHAIDRIVLWNRSNAVSYGTSSGSATGNLDSLLPSRIIGEQNNLSDFELVELSPEILHGSTNRLFLRLCLSPNE
ncbi:MAG: hypothetical protein AAGA18_15165 [Verrucomicrobiota bacterium]